MSSKVVLKNVSIAKDKKLYKAVKLVNILDPESFDDLYTTESSIFQYYQALGLSLLNLDRYEELNKLEPINQDPEIFRPTKELFHVPLALALLISVVIAVAHIRISASSHRAFTNFKSRINISIPGGELWRISGYLRLSVISISSGRTG